MSAFSSILLLLSDASEIRSLGGEHSGDSLEEAGTSGATLGDDKSSLR